MRSWGSLPFSLIDSWKGRKCDLVFTSLRMQQSPVTVCGGPLPLPSLVQSLTALAGGGKAKSSSSSSSSDPASLPLIAVMAATTTRKVANPSTDNLALFTMLLPSLVRSIDCGFRYVHVLGYDQGDPFYDNEGNIRAIEKWFKTNIQDPMAANGVSLVLKLVRVNNSLKKPGPVFIAMARAAFDMGECWGCCCFVDFFRAQPCSALLCSALLGSAH